jgi:hypothetical protein
VTSAGDHVAPLSSWPVGQLRRCAADASLDQLIERRAATTVTCLAPARVVFSHESLQLAVPVETADLDQSTRPSASPSTSDQTESPTRQSARSGPRASK